MTYWDPAGKVDVMDVLDILEIDNVRREGQHEARFSCPFPNHENGDASASAYMNLETCKWYCHGCKRRGNVILFVSSMYDISPMKAKRLLRQAYDPASLDDQQNIIEELHQFFAKRHPFEAPVNTPISEEFLQNFVVDWDEADEAFQDRDGFPPHDYMFDRGFWPQTLTRWQFGYDERTRRITLPVRDESGRLIGFKGRATDGRRPKYLVLGDDHGVDGWYGFPRYYTGSVVFGLHRIPSQHADLIICEGELNAVALHQCGYTNAVALNGSNLTERQARLIRTYADTVLFYFDFDKAGEEALWGRVDEETGEEHPGLLERLALYIDNVRLVAPHHDDPARLLELGCIGEIHQTIARERSWVKAALERKIHLRS